ncbi:hypothetical protein BRCON_2237 [Candidatus Sumerlaea chitinivorans]|uniref:Uncharacterized protein n=1 Tax=Sumerlaea chitinivorans TaxID=2250252 RepID=A0A2Z4Y717_SUMC1|nr:hypothetical protein BRCON_2237 [Candidatus Sumerlaea chitinivorans]
MGVGRGRGAWGCMRSRGGGRGVTLHGVRDGARAPRLSASHPYKSLRIGETGFYNPAFW